MTDKGNYSGIPISQNFDFTNVPISGIRSRFAWICFTLILPPIIEPVISWFFTWRTDIYRQWLMEGGVKVCGDAVLRYFWRGFAEIFILTCGILVLLDYTVCGVKKVWVTVIGDHEVSAAFWDPLSCFFSFCFSKPSVSTISRCNSLHSQGPLLYKQALRFLVVDLVGLAAFCIISNDKSIGDLRLGCPVVDL